MAKISRKAYEDLRLILEEQYNQAFTREEVNEIGDGLIDFYQMLVAMVEGATKKEDQN